MEETTSEYKVKMLKQALLDVCQAIREHHLDMDWHFEDMERLAILSGGIDRDPKGLEYAAYFLQKAKEKIAKEEEKNEADLS